MFINSYIHSVIAGLAHKTSDEPQIDSRSELDLHANMVVMGSECFVFEWSGKTCQVNPFTKSIGTMNNVPIVDAAIAYDCPYSHQTYILICRNSLYIPEMRENLLPPFILRESGATVNDTAKIHCKDPGVDDHCISFMHSNLTIPLQLHGTFSFFHSRKPTGEELVS